MVERMHFWYCCTRCPLCHLELKCTENHLHELLMILQWYNYYHLTKMSIHSGENYGISIMLNNTKLLVFSICCDQLITRLFNYAASSTETPYLNHDQFQGLGSMACFTSLKNLLWLKQYFHCPSNIPFFFMNHNSNVSLGHEFLLLIQHISTTWNSVVLLISNILPFHSCFYLRV